LPKWVDIDEKWVIMDERIGSSSNLPKWGVIDEKWVIMDERIGSSSNLPQWVVIDENGSSWMHRKRLITKSPRMYGLPWMRNGSSWMHQKRIITELPRMYGYTTDAPIKGHHGIASNVWVTMDEKWVIMDVQCIKAQQLGSR
jgi:hypothetical protein